MQLSSQAPELPAQSRSKAEPHTAICTELKANRKCQGQKPSTNIPLLVSAKVGFVETTKHPQPGVKVAKPISDGSQCSTSLSPPGPHPHWHPRAETHSYHHIWLKPTSLELSDRWISWWVIFGAAFPLMLSGFSSTQGAAVIWVQGQHMHLGWKRSPRSSSSTFMDLHLCQPEQSTECHIQMFLEHLQGWGL